MNFIKACSFMAGLAAGITINYADPTSAQKLYFYVDVDSKQFQESKFSVKQINPNHSNRDSKNFSSNGTSSTAPIVLTHTLNSHSLGKHLIVRTGSNIKANDSVGFLYTMSNPLHVDKKKIGFASIDSIAWEHLKGDAKWEFAYTQGKSSNLQFMWQKSELTLAEQGLLNTLKKHNHTSVSERAKVPHSAKMMLELDPYYMSPLQIDLGPITSGMNKTLILRSIDDQNCVFITFVQK